MTMPKGWKPGQNRSNYDHGVSSIKCKQCNNVCRIDMRFCTNCGSKLQDEFKDRIDSQTVSYKDFGTYKLQKYNIEVLYPLGWTVFEHSMLPDVAEDGVLFGLVDDSLPCPPSIGIGFLEDKEDIKIQEVLEQYSLKEVIRKHVLDNKDSQLVNLESTLIGKRQAVKYIKRSGTTQSIVATILVQN